MNNFVHLHVHSHYSLLDGLPKIAELVARCGEYQMTALALTDHSNLYGAIEFIQTARRHNIKPLLGLEANITPDGIVSHNPREQLGHIVLLARTLQGWHNLIQLATAGHLEGTNAGIPRIDYDLLKKYGDGLIILTGCLEGEIPRALHARDTPRAENILAHYRAAVGIENVYCELVAPGAHETQAALNQLVVEFAAATGAPLVATADCHYLEPQDAEAADLLNCIGSGTKVTDPDRISRRDLDLSFRTADEMVKLFTDQPEAIKNTGRIADRCDVPLELDKLHFAAFPIPTTQTAAGYLTTQAQTGLAQRYGGTIPTEATERLDYELDIIIKKGFTDYFLIVADFMNWAREREITVTTRGSAAGSLVSYAIGVTTVNPLDYQLPFERFLNPYRPSPPDIDSDIADDRRDEVLAYVKQLYGVDRVAQIGTFGTMQARAAVRDVGRALGLPYGLCDRIAKMIPLGAQGFPMTLARAKKENPELAEAEKNDAEVARLLDLAERIEGCSRHCSVHAAGVVIAPGPLTDFTPLQHDPTGTNVITQFDMHAVETVGLVKMDFLGIRNLAILDRARRLVAERTGTIINLDTLPLNDPKTYALLAAGRTVGLFQLGGEGMTRALVDLRPTQVTDIMAMVALYRPGPMNSIAEYVRRKRDPSLVTYLDERLKPLLERSYGILVYQDDVLLIAIQLAGYTWEEADKLRKAMGKKIPAEMAAQKAKLIKGLMDHGMSQEKSVAMWQLIEPFAAYGFGKAHACSYGLVAYQTAYFKANFPVEYMTAVMSAESGDLEKVAEAVTEARAMGIEVAGPDVNESNASFAVTGPKNIRFGLSAVKNLGEDTIRAILDERNAHGPYPNLTEFLTRIPERAIHRRALESLVRSGALDRLGDRGQLLASIETMLEFGRRQHSPTDTRQVALFAAASNTATFKLADAPPLSQSLRLADEKEFLGLYLSGSPLAPYRAALAPLLAASSKELMRIAGVITTIKKLITRKHEPMMFVTLEGDTRVDLVVFPSTLRATADLWVPDAILLVDAHPSEQARDARLIVDRAWRVDESTITKLVEELCGPRAVEHEEICVNIPEQFPPDLSQQLKEIFSSTPGQTRVILLVNDGAQRRLVTPYFIDTQTAREPLEKLLGPHALQS